MQELKLKIKGLYTFPNELSEVPDGALERAVNINIDKESVATPRRGEELYSATGFGTGSSRANKIWEYQDKNYVHYDTGKIAYYDGAVWQALTGSSTDSYPPPSGTRTRTAEGNSNLYFTTTTGIKKLDVFNGTPADSGVPKGLNISGSLTGASGYLANTNSVAYRLVWGIKDANDNLILSAPSQRYVITNSSGGTRDVSLTSVIPSGITVNHFYQYYRSEQIAGDPSDEMQLVLEGNPTAGELTAGLFTVTDNTPDDLRGAALYTSPSQETIVNANEQPPLAKDIATFKNHLFYGNIKQRHRLFITLLAADGTAIAPSVALKYDDVITINGVSYTGKATTTIASNEFAVATGGTLSTRIRDTALELINVINRSASNTGPNAIYAYYVSGVNESPGRILLESRSPGGAQFSVTFTPVVAGANPWNPKLPTSGTSVQSTNDEFLNGLMFSKLNEPEAVPLINIFRVGQADKPIRRIMPLRDSLFIIKDDGVYRLTGTDSASFNVDLFDNTVRIYGEETAALLNNSIYFLSDQGVAQCTETGIGIVSRPIEDKFLRIIRENLNAVISVSFAFGYETERKYILGTITEGSDTYATIYHVYNTFTRAWTEWNDVDATIGVVDIVTDKILWGDAVSNFLYVERKTGTPSDFARDGGTITISTISPDGLFITTPSINLLEKGCVLQQSGSVFSIVRDVDFTTGIVTMYFNGGLTAGSADLYFPINSVIEWVPFHAGNPGILKHFREIGFLFKRNFAIEIEAGFRSELSSANENIIITSELLGNWGFFNWGQLIWGGQQVRNPVRTYVPRDKSRCTQLTCFFQHDIGFSDFELNGASLIFETMSERFSR